MADRKQAYKVAILGSQQSWHCQVLQTAFSLRGIEVVYTDPTLLHASLGNHASVGSGGLNLTEFDLLLVREVPGGSLEQVIFRMDALHQLENSGVRVINTPYAIEKMVDKYYTLSLLQDAGLKVPDTFVCENYSQAVTAFGELGGDVVLKPLFGSRGVGMVRLTDPEIAGRTFKALQLSGFVYYLQQFIPHDNRDLRVMVVGQDCIAAMEREADGWKTNIANGGKPLPANIDLEIQSICLKAASTLGAHYCGVDLLHSETGELYLLEVNSMPAWQGLQQVTSVDIAGQVVDYCLSLTGFRLIPHNL